MASSDFWNESGHALIALFVPYNALYIPIHVTQWPSMSLALVVNS